MTEQIINSIIYFALCFTLPHVCVFTLFEGKSKFTKVSAVIALIAFFYIGFNCVKLN